MNRILATAVLLALVSGCTLQQQRADVALTRGEAALDARDLNRAIAELTAAVELNPELVDAHASLGEAHWQSGNLSEAAEALEAAVQLDPLHFEALRRLGDVYRVLKDLTKCIRAYALACEIEPTDFEAHYRLASAYHELGELGRAIETYNTALRLEPRRAQAWGNLGAAYDANGQPYEAIRAYKRSLECNTNQPIVLVNMATVYLNQERFETARTTLAAALRMAPDLSIAHERMGYIQWRGQEHREAIASYERALEINPNNARALAGMGVVRMTQYLNDPGATEYRVQAVEWWHRSLEVDPQQPRLRSLIEKYRVRKEAPVLSIEG